MFFLHYYLCLFHSAVELQIMFTCMYMALWATNFITIVKDTDDLSEGTEALFQFMMLIPILVAFHRIAYIAETYSLIMAISELNLEVICKYFPLPNFSVPLLLPSNSFYPLFHFVDEVLVNTEDMLRLAEELRAKIRSKIHKWAGTTQPTEEQEREVGNTVLHSCFYLCLSPHFSTVLPTRFTTVRAPVVHRSGPGR